MKSIIYKILLLCQIIKEYISYNETIPFNWTQNPLFCYREDFVFSNNYRTLQNEIYPIRGCNSSQRNFDYAQKIGLMNIFLFRGAHLCQECSNFVCLKRQ
jgi:hypothetical protein